MFAKAAITGTLQAGATTFDAEYLVVAGGGGGGGMAGGGAGGYRTATDLSIALGTPYTVTVGAGGSGASGGGFRGSNGVDSVFSSVTSAGGGTGGAYSNTLGAGVDGGSGGGGGALASSPYTGQPAGSGNVPSVSPSQGNDGGDNGSNGAGGGGGGAGAVGGDAVSLNGGSGGSGTESLITGSSVYRAGGGGGGGFSALGAGGIGGGGNGGKYSGSAATAGTANTGGGGGGGYNAAGGAGGSGVVIIRVPSSVVAEFSAGVVYNYIPLDDFNVYEVTAAGVSDTVTFSQGAVTTVGESLRFNDDDSAYLDGTYSASATNTKATFAFWYKSGFISASQMLYQARDNNSVNNLRTFLQVAGGTFRVRMYNSAAAQVCALNTTRVFRDPSAWYHLVFQFDTTQATASDRVKLYVNGVLNTDFSVATTYPPLNFAFRTVSSVYTDIGRNGGVNTNLIDGYLADYYFIDGQALDPSRFGKQDADGVWQPISYTGTYGTNGFHLDFADNSTAAALGTDVSGNGNDWTPSGITTDDQVTDTPSVNWATLNPLDRTTHGSLANGNLDLNTSGGTAPNAFGTTRATFGLSSGKWYWEITPTSFTDGGMIGIMKSSASLSLGVGQDSSGWSYLNGGAKYTGASASAYGASYTTSDVIGVAFDADTGTLDFYKNGASQGTAFTGLTSGPYFPAISDNAGSSAAGSIFVANFGQRPFAYTPPAGFQSLSSANLPAPVIADGKEHFQPALYTGNGTSQTVRGLEFQPDLVWIKSRSTAQNNYSIDAVRGVNNILVQNNTNGEAYYDATWRGLYGNLTSFHSNGFTVVDGTDPTYDSFNGAGDTYVAWNWNAGGSTVTNTDGTITSQVRANTDAGFSIVGWTGGGVAGTTGHGLSEAPELYIYKNRSIATNWAVAYTIVDGSLDFMYLNLTNAAGNAVQALPTSSVIDLNVGAGDVNSGQNYIAYCFHSVDGFSKFGTYTGNGSTDGPFIYTGFRPAFVIVKSYTSGYYWVMKDNKRAAAYNPATGNLYPNDFLVEDTVATANIDLLANGFKFRGTYVGTNGSGIGYIFMAFAENPFKTARAR